MNELVSVAMGVLGGGTFGSLITAYLGRKKTAAEANNLEANSFKVETEAAVNLVEAYRLMIKPLQEDQVRLANDLKATREEHLACEEKLASMRTNMRRIQDRLERLEEKDKG